MQDTTLCLLLRENEILLAMKKRGFGEGNWNGVGGKVEPGEDLRQAAARELEEEVKIVADPNELIEFGQINFYFTNKSEWNQKMNIFVLKNWNGEPVETEEMRPKWFRFTEIPYSEMWVDDQYWLPEVLKGNKVEASFYFKEDGKSFDNYELKTI